MDSGTYKYHDFSEKLEKTYSIEKLLTKDNAAEILDEKDCETIAKCVVDDFLIDDRSREPWKAKYKDCTKAALQMYEQKTSPWEGASNVKFPIITVAALNFQSRAFPQLVSSPDLVKCSVTGDDTDGSETQKAERISTFMSYQLLVQDEEWKEDTDRLLFMLPIVGCLVRKTYFNPITGRNCSEVIMPEDFVVSYFTRSLAQCPRATVILHQSERIVKNKTIQEYYIPAELGQISQGEDSNRIYDALLSERGYIRPENDPSEERPILEQYTYFDLDGDDYAEPYIITVDLSSRKMLRLTPNFTPSNIKYDTDGQIQAIKNQMQQTVQQPLPPNATEQQNKQELLRRQSDLQSMSEQIQALQKQSRIIDIEPIQYFTKYPFVPSPDGSFYDIGFGQLLFPINAAIDTLINQLTDAGTLQNSNVGFAASNARLRGADFRFRPNEFKRVDVPAGSLKDAIMPLPVNQPSQVLLSLMELLISYAERISSTTDVMVGETPGQNTPATTTMAAMEQAQKIFSGILLRLYRAESSEFRKLYKLNSIYLNPIQYYNMLGTGTSRAAFQQDFTGDPNRVDPQADPTVSSDAQRLGRAQAVLSMSATIPGFNQKAIVEWVLKEMKIPGAKLLYTGAPPPPNPEIQLKAMDMARKTTETDHKMRLLGLEVLAKVKTAEAQAIAALAQAKKLGDDTAIRGIETQIMAFSEIHSAIANLEANQIERESIQQQQQEAQQQQQQNEQPQSAASST